MGVKGLMGTVFDVDIVNGDIVFDADVVNGDSF